MRKIAIFGRQNSRDSKAVLKRVLSILCTNKVEIHVEQTYFELNKECFEKQPKLYGFRDNPIDRTCELMISIGGDGTILRAVTFIGFLGIPILGINTGRLGFLATVNQELIEKRLAEYFNNDYQLSFRTMLEVFSNYSNASLKEVNFALNEVTVSRKDTTSMITIDTYLNQDYLTSYWADGLIVSTPTGSTGYSLSCGGPVITPEAESLVLTPIAPHNLNARPLVIKDDIEVKLKVSGREDHFLVALDSRITTFDNSSELIIKKSVNKLGMIKFKDEGFLKTIRKKLLWGEDRRN